MVCNSENLTATSFLGPLTPTSPGLQHYPNRLHKMEVVGLPDVLKWVFTSLRPMMAAVTAAKIRMCEPGDLAVRDLIPGNLPRGMRKRAISAPPEVFEVSCQP
jgi:hypothetical protein